jgi:thymidylate synthase
MLNRDIKDLPELKMNSDIQNIQGFRYEDFEILNYNSHPNIKMEVAV